MNGKDRRFTNDSSVFPIRVFRETPQVSFFDASVDGSNGADVVVHQQKRHIYS